MKGFFKAVGLLGLVMMSAGLLIAQTNVLVMGWNQTAAAPKKINADAFGNMITILPCALSAPISVSATGNTQLIAATAGKAIQICHFSFSGATTTDVKLTTGTGSNCATGSADLTGAYGTVQSIALDMAGTLAAPVGKALCLNLATGHVYGGVITYALR